MKKITILPSENNRPFLTGENYRVIIDGQDVSKNVRNITIDIGVGKINRATIEFIGVDIEIPEVMVKE